MFFEHLLTFVSHHWMLCAAFAVALLFLLVEEVKGGSASEGRFVSSQTTTRLMNRDSAVAVDIRSREQFEKGHIAGSHHLPGDQFSPDQRPLAQCKKTPVIVVCERGRSAQVKADVLDKAGFEKVHVLRGGITAWRQDKMPLVKGKK